MKPNETQLSIAGDAIRSMTDSGPRDLKKRIQALLTESGEKVSIDEMIGLFFVSDANAPQRLQYDQTIRVWDKIANAKWTEDTAPWSQPRRMLIYQKLGLTPEHEKQTEDHVTLYESSRATVIAPKHEDWYTPERRNAHPYFWTKYVEYLREHKGFSERHIQELDMSSAEVVERLSDPAGESSYQTKGLVVGYVQSGKTTNFTAVIARAVDAGYRLIVVFAGTTNLLRDQTQRRIDKELLGRPIVPDDEYRNASDESEFMRHDESWRREGCGWVRLTGEMADYKNLERGVHALEIDHFDRKKPIWHADNLRNAPARLIIIKKQSDVLASLHKNLKRLLANKADLRDIPALFIDDESDQASVNTKKPSAMMSTSKPSATTETSKRTTINRLMTGILGEFSRSQYIAYTATPFANVFINPEDAADLFPKDYIISLPRPVGYMGVQAFVDIAPPESDGAFESNESRYVRRLTGDDDAETNLPTALRAYLLSGAIKLYREASYQKKYPNSSPIFRHHTMLVNTDSTKAAHEEMRRQVDEAWTSLGIATQRGMKALKALWEEDFFPMMQKMKGEDVIPPDFDTLRPYLGEVVSRLERGSGNITLVVNSDESSVAPDFSTDSCWKVVVGGNKLSRGYTIEGLTISYFRRLSQGNDTMMQMGRWFGYRNHYRDLVRLYIGASEGDRDLYEYYRDLCIQEEDFRARLSQYEWTVDESGHRQRTLPKYVPPLVALVRGTTPTARNKMYNSELVEVSLSDDWWGPRDIAGPDTCRAAERSLRAILADRDIESWTGSLQLRQSIDAPLETREVTLTYSYLTYADLDKFLTESGVYALHGAQRHFLQNAEHRKYLQRWILVNMGGAKSKGEMFECGGKSFSVSQRQGRGISGKLSHSVSDLRTRAMADFLRLRSPGVDRIICKDLEKLQNNTQGVLLFTPIRQKHDDAQAPLVMGFELLTPACGAAALSMVRAKAPNLASQVVIDACDAPALPANRKRRRHA